MSTGTPADFPTDWDRCLVLVAHPDDPEYGMSAAVSRWTSEGRSVVYVLATSGEEGIEGMPPEECGPVREEEQRRSSAVVGVDVVEFLGFPDSRLADTPGLHAAVTEAVRRHRPDLVLGLYSGPEWAPGAPNQSDHMEFGAAVAGAITALVESGDEAAPRYFFESCPQPTHSIAVDGHVEKAVEALCEHREYLSVLDPSTPVEQQARAQVERVTGGADGPHVVGFREM